MGKVLAMSVAKTKKAAAAKVKTVASVTTKDKAAEDSACEALELTEKNVGKHNLDSLVKKLKSGELEDEKFMAQLDNKQKMALWKRLEVGRSKHPTAGDQWCALTKLGRGDNKDGKKRMLLLAYLKNGACGDGYMKVADSLVLTKTKTQNMRWLSWKETTDKFGDVEAKSRVQQGSLPVRKDPRDGRFFQFLVVEDSNQLTMAQQRELQSARETKLGKDDFKHLGQCLRMDMDEDMTEDIWDEKFEGVMALKDLKERDEEGDGADDKDDEDGTASHLPKELKDQLGLCGAAKDKKKGKADKPDRKTHFDDKVDQMSQVGDGNGAVALRKCNLMHGLLSKQTLKIRQLEASLQKKRCLPRANTPPSRSSWNTPRRGWTRTSQRWTKQLWKRRAPWSRRRSCCWTAPPIARLPTISSSCCRTWTRPRTDTPGEEAACVA